MPVPDYGELKADREAWLREPLYVDYATESGQTIKLKVAEGEEAKRIRLEIHEAAMGYLKHGKGAEVVDASQ